LLLSAIRTLKIPINKGPIRKIQKQIVVLIKDLQYSRASKPYFNIDFVRLPALNLCNINALGKKRENEKINKKFVFFKKIC
jgi:hypothetical protein